MMSFRAILVVALMLALNFASAETPPTVDPDALRRSLDMLKLQMKLRVLQVHYERAGFYYPPEWPQRIQKEYQDLADAAEVAGRQQIAGMDDWLEQQNKERKNEVLAMYKLAESVLPKLIAQDKGHAESVQKWLDENKPAQNKRQNSLEIARYVEGLAEKIYAVNKDKDNAGISADLIQQWRQGASKVYRGAVADTDNLITKITEYERKRVWAESRLAFLKQVEEGLQIAKDAQAPVEKLKSVIEDQAIERAQEYLEDHFLDVPPEVVKNAWGTLKKEVESFSGMYSAVTELDSNAALKGNPTALAAAKRFTLLSGIYSYTLGKVADFPAIKPIAKMLTYYGDVIAAIPKIAIWAQTMVTRVDQDYRNVRALDAWQVTDMPPGDLRQLSMFDSFGLQVATSSEIDMSSANARFYMLVPKEVVPRGYATLNLEQFRRLTQVLADERFVNAPDDASRSISDWLTENMFEWRSTDVASAKVSDAFLADLRKSVRKAVFTPQQALELAQAKAPVEIAGQSWTAEKYRTKAEARLDKLADEMLLRESLYRFNKDESPKKWTAFHGLMLQHGVALSPQQILKLFNFYQQSDTHAAHLASWFKRVVEDAAKDKLGKADVGIPVISSSAAATDISTGGTVKLTANLLVSELAPGRKVEAVIDWNLPQGGTKPQPVKVTLENGAKTIDREITVPPGVSKAEVKARMIVKIEEPASARQTAPPGVNELFQGAPLPSPAIDDAKVVREYTGRTVDAPLRFDPQAPKVELGFYKSGTSPQEFQGVRVTPPKVDGIRNWQIYRARSTDGPWVLVTLSYFTGDTLLDTEVAKLVGRHTWYYAAIPRAMDQFGHRERNPDISHWSAIAVEQVISAPKLKVESLNWEEKTWRHASEEYRRDLEKKRDERAQNRRKELESLQSKAASPDVRQDDRAYYRKEEQFARRRHAMEDFTDSRELLVSWELPEMRGVLQGIPAKDVYLHLFRATDPDGPFEKVASYKASDQLSYPLSDSLAGLPYYYQARFYHRGLYFDWASTSGTEPLIRRGTVNAVVSERNSMMRFEVGAGQRVRIRVEEAQFESKKEEFNPYFAAHGPEGIDEGRLAAFARDERQKLIQKFWEGRRQPRNNEERAELETDLAKRLKQFDERAYPAFRSKAPMPGVRLGAIIGRLIPFVKGNNTPAAVQQPQYFYIGRETAFTAPQAGSIEVSFNWPDNFEYEAATEVRLAAGYESLMQEPTPAFGQPAWKRNTLPAGPDNNWSVEFGVQGWQPGPDQEVISYIGPSAEGPWYSHRVLDKSGQIYRQTNIKPDQELWLRMKLRSVPKSTYRPTGVYLGETWSAPYPLRLGPQPLYLWLTAGGTSQLMNTAIFGRRGQTMQLQVTGQWDPFRVPGLAPYGPEGVPEETYRKFALQMQEKEKTMSSDQLNSNRPGLLGVEMQGTGQASKPTGGLQNLSMWLVRKDAMLAPDLPAGALISQFTPMASPEIQVAHNSGFYQGASWGQGWFPVSRNWTFTFPADGMVSLAANFGFSWVGRHNFYGEGQLKLDFTMSAPNPAYALDGAYADWKLPPPPRPDEIQFFNKTAYVEQMAAIDTRTASDARIGGTDNVTPPSTTPGVRQPVQNPPNVPAPGTVPSTTPSTGGNATTARTGTNALPQGVNPATALPQNTPVSNTEQVDALLNARRLAEALTGLRQLATAQPNDLEIRLKWAGLESLMGDRNAAGVEAARLARLFPNDARTWMLQGQIAFWNNDQNTARQMFDYANKLQPSLARQIYDQGMKYYQTGIPEMAMQHISTAMAMDYNQFYVGHFYLGYVYMGLNQPQRAVIEFETYLQRDGTSEWAAKVRATLQQIRGQ